MPPSLSLKDPPMKRALVLAAALALVTVPASAAPTHPDWKVVGHIAGPDGGWDYVSYDPAHHAMLVSRPDGVLRVDTATGQATPKWVPGARLHESLTTPGGLGLSTNGGDNTATIFDSATGKVLGSVPTGTGPDAAVFDPASGLVFVMNGKSGDLTPVDLKGIKALGAIAIGGKLEFGAADGKGRLFVNVEDKGEIAVIDTRTRKLVRRIPLKGCEEPGGLAYDSRHGLLVAACQNSKAEVVDARSGRVIKTLVIDHGPDAAFYDAKRNLMFVPCGRDGLLDVIAMGDAKALKVIAHVPTAKGARTGALDEATGQIYLPTAKYGPAPAGGGRPPMIPGSFEVLVVGR
jgi:DNA-binding beta-propeller fold protein YncE